MYEVDMELEATTTVKWESNFDGSIDVADLVTKIKELTDMGVGGIFEDSGSTKTTLRAEYTTTICCPKD